MSKVIGIDISKQTFDVCFREENKLLHEVYANNSKGFKEFIESDFCKSDPIVVMELQVLTMFVLQVICMTCY